jgi:hypothetical protein
MELKTTLNISCRYWSRTAPQSPLDLLDRDAPVPLEDDTQDSPPSDPELVCRECSRRRSDHTSFVDDAVKNDANDKTLDRHTLQPDLPRSDF